MPLAFLFTGGVPWRLLGIAVGVILAAACYLEVKHASHLKLQLDIAAKIASDNAVIAESARQAVEQANAVAAQVVSESKMTQKTFSVRKRKIADAPQTDDGPLAPVLRRVLDGLPGEDSDKIGASKYAPAPGEPDHMSGWP